MGEKEGLSEVFLRLSRLHYLVEKGQVKRFGTTFDYCIVFLCKWTIR